MSLIITTGDISDADGFICLADYAKHTDADILFIMNYPAYFNFYYEKEHEETNTYEGFNYGLKGSSVLVIWYIVPILTSQFPIS